ncbi:MAG: polysaccharide deacetylase family protein, partial [Gaiellaceae bacterium MAG52_C11]|nr:polysaccharide deacetylase family protein [Candidatus Gaiellasilicea maunaloa]
TVRREDRGPFLKTNKALLVPGWYIERYPHAVAAIVEGGHEIAHHGYLHEYPRDQTRKSELYWLERGAAVIADFTGKRPVGWRGPWAGSTANSTELLVQEWYLYDSTLMADSQPYPDLVRGG